MVNEHVLVLRKGTPIDFIVGDTPGQEKGTLMNATDPRTASGSAVEGEACSGVAHREKISGDGRTRLAIHQSGVFRAKASGAVTMGHALISAGLVNEVKQAPVTASGAEVIGQSLEDAGNGDTFEYELRIGAGGAQIS